ncbi:MAG: hypothetical protein IT385_00030 [Deltaproteobacteria bacterium]|nr:hypothetical protein [Deltaproteobacteria bacterium]
MEARDNQGIEVEPDTRPSAPRPRRPYVPPVIVSGEAFERVQLSSGCNEGLEDCEVPC